MGDIVIMAVTRCGKTPVPDLPWPEELRTTLHGTDYRFMYKGVLQDGAREKLDAIAERICLDNRISIGHGTRDGVFDTFRRKLCKEARKAGIKLDPDRLELP